MSRDGARSDEDLMRAYAAGDAAAFDALYQRHRGWLYNTLCRQMDNRSRVDDVFQETWLSLIRSAARYQASARFTTWLYLLARQRLVDEWRRLNPVDDAVAFNEDGDQADNPDLIAALTDHSSDPLVQAQRRQLAQLIEQALQALPPLQREAFLLAEYADMSLEDIAQATASTRETVKSRLRYARAKLQQHLAGATR